LRGWRSDGGLLQRGFGLLERAGASTADRHLRAADEQRGCDRSADSAGSARHNRYFAVKLRVLDHGTRIPACPMSVVAIIGAGDLGGALASKLAGRDYVREVRLVDRAAGVAAGKALDIQQAGPIERTATRLSSSADLGAVEGAAVIAIADELGPPVAEIESEAGLALLKRLRAAAVHAPIVCAGASQAWLVGHAAAELDIPTTQLVGSAPLALLSALRALIALELNGSAQDVSVTLTGQPPHAIVVPWHTASMQGESLERLLDPAALRRIEWRLRYLWPPGPYALAAAAARFVESLVAGSRRTLCGFVADRGSSGSPRALARPVRTEPGPGSRWHVRTLDPPALSPQQRVALDAIH
jgi:malate/lactate dehydrogenase